MKFSYLIDRFTGKVLVVASVCVGMLAMSAPASADSTFSVQFFQSTESNAAHSDFHTGSPTPTGTESYTYVQGSLSGGMPVYNSSYTTAPGFSTPAAANDFTSGNVLGWWTAGTYNGVNTVSSTGSNVSFVVSSDPNNPTNMFPPNSTGTSNANDEETAILSGQFNLASPGTVTFSIGADDDAFIYIDDVYMGGLGGIHAISGLTSFTSASLGSGVHDVEIFYADQDQVAASLAFSSGDTVITPTSPTPEPGSLALLGTGILAIGGTLRRRMTR